MAPYGDRCVLGPQYITDRCLLGAVQISRDRPMGREGVFQMITKDRGGEGGGPLNDHK